MSIALTVSNACSRCVRAVSECRSVRDADIHLIAVSMQHRREVLKELDMIKMIVKT